MSLRQPDPTRPTLRLGFFLAALVILMSAVNSAFGAEGRWELAIGTTAAAPQTAVELPVVLTSNGASVSAIAFTVEFDASKLALDGGPTLGSKVEIPAPTMFTSSSWVGNEAGAIGVVVYDNVRPIGVLADGPIANIRFRVLPNATGVAPVRVSASRPFSASGPRGEPLEGDIAAAGGVTIVTATGTAVAEAPEIRPSEPRDRLLERPRGSEEEKTLVVPLLSDRGGDRSHSSSLMLHNRGETMATARLTLLRNDGRGAAGPAEVSLPAGATRAWNDAAAELFGLPLASGAIVIETTGDLLLAASADDLGQIVGAEPSRDDLRIFALDDSDRSRSTVAIANVDSREGSFTVEVRDAEGALLDLRTIRVDARSTRELPLRRNGLPVGDGLTLLIRSDGARYSAWTATFLGEDAPVVRIAR